MVNISELSNMSNDQLLTLREHLFDYFDSSSCDEHMIYNETKYDEMCNLIDSLFDELDGRGFGRLNVVR